jgi:hypothetical protein
MKTKPDRFIQGYICACCCMIEMDGMIETRTREMYRQGAGNNSLDELKKLGVPENDLLILEKHWEELKKHI